jgi:hypothetical protein
MDSVGEIPPAVGVFASPLVSVSIGAMHMRLTSDSVMLSQEPYPFAGSNMYIGYDRISPIDWGVAVVGPAGDTVRDQSGCAFQNPGYSNSSFSNRMWIASDANGLELRYTSDKVEWDLLDTASYKILVTYVDGPKDSVTATPQLLIVCGSAPIPLGKPLTAVYQASPVNPLHKGETWYAGDLEAPTMKFKPAGPIRLQKLAQ